MVKQKITDRIKNLLNPNKIVGCIDYISCEGENIERQLTFQKNDYGWYCSDINAHVAVDELKQVLKIVKELNLIK